MEILIGFVCYLLVGTSYSIYIFKRYKHILENYDNRRAGLVSFAMVSLWPYFIAMDTWDSLVRVWARFKVRKLIKKNEVLIREKEALLKKLMELRSKNES